MLDKREVAVGSGASENVVLLLVLLDFLVD
jgi:hypothetical protein